MLNKILTLFRLQKVSPETDFHSLENREGIYYAKNIKTPYTGIVKKYFDNKLLKEIGYLKDGKYHNTVKTYNKSNKVISILNFKNGVRHGKFKSFYDNGKVKEIGYFKDGLLNGVIRMYYKNGKLVSKIRYIDGEIKP